MGTAMSTTPGAFNVRTPYRITPAGRQYLTGRPTDLLTRELQALVLLTRPTPLNALACLIPGVDAATVRGMVARLHALRLIEPVPEAAPSSTAGLFDNRSSAPPDHSPGELKAVEGDTHRPELDRPGLQVTIARRSPRRLPPTSGEHHALLVIEDGTFVARAYHKFLSLLGYRMMYAATQAEIVSAIEQHGRPDLVLLDLNLTNGDGFEVLHQLSEHQRLAAVPVVVASGYTTRRSILCALSGGASGYLTKPLFINGLVDTLRAVLGLPTVDRQADAEPAA